MNKYKVLLIDDNSDMLIIGKRIFERAGHTFIESRSGEEGLAVALTEQPDIIVLDYMLPDMYGTDFIFQLSGDDHYRGIQDIPIVILTARPDYIKDLDKCYKLGLRAYLNKPFGHRELVNVVENIIRYDKLLKGWAQERKVPEAQPETNGVIRVRKEWYEDVQAVSDALRGLCRDLMQNDFKNMTEEQLVELDAIYNSSLRLDKLLQKRG